LRKRKRGQAKEKKTDGERERRELVNVERKGWCKRKERTDEREKDRRRKKKKKEKAD
jgi:hypothetical protein